MNSTGTPGGSGIPAGWYDDPSGQGLRWWDGDAWTEHVHTAESAAAASGGTAAETDGSHEERPPRELVALRENLRGRGKGFAMILGGAVLVIVIVALLVSGGSDKNGGGTFEPGFESGPTLGVPGGAPSKQAETTVKEVEKKLKEGGNGALKQLKREQKALKSANGDKSIQKGVEEAEKQLGKAGGKNVQKQIEAAEKAAQEAIKKAE